MQKGVIYPYDISNLYIAMFSKQSADTEIISAVSPRGWGYDGHDAGYKYGIHTGINVEYDLNTELEKADVLIITDSIIKLEDDKIDCAVKAAESSNKKVIDLRSRAACNGTEKVKIIDNRIKKIPKPVVLVIGASERCGKFDMQLFLKGVFENQGYKAAVIGSKSGGSFWGINDYPDFMYSNELQEYEKILAFNHYVYKLSMCEENDVIIIGVPGGIARYDDKHPEFFGIQNFYVSNAVNPDYVVMNVPYVDFAGEYINSSVSFVKQRYNYYTDAVVLSNSYINADATSEREEIIYTSLTESFISGEAEKMGVYSLFSEESRNKLGKNLIDTLEGYSEVSTI